MEDLLNNLSIIEEEHKDFFEKNNLKLTKYISISKKPVMIRFNTLANDRQRLTDEIYQKVNNLIMSYYGS
jgi:hypothetical protein